MVVVVVVMLAAVELELSVEFIVDLVLLIAAKVIPEMRSHLLDVNLHTQ